MSEEKESGDEAEAEGLVRKAVSQSRLMSGENPESREPADADHWIRVYSDLLGFKSKMLTEMAQSLPRMLPEAASEVGEIDVTLLGRQAQKYQERLSFWEERAQELAGNQSTMGDE